MFVLKFVVREYCKFALKSKFLMDVGSEIIITMGSGNVMSPPCELGMSAQSH